MMDIGRDGPHHRVVEDADPYDHNFPLSLSTKKIDAPKCVDFSYHWEFLTVMNSASTRRVVSGFRKE